MLDGEFEALLNKKQWELNTPGNSTNRIERSISIPGIFETIRAQRS